MTRLALFTFGTFAIALATGAGCAKPTEADCRKAIANMRHVMGTENLHDEGKLESEVRRCRGGSSKKAVECAIKAQTLDELRHCEFFKLPENLQLPGSAGSGSAVTPPAGSDSGSAGSAASPADGAGSAATPPTAGSASGSVAPTGSAASPGAAAGPGATGAGSAIGSAK